VPEGSTIPTGNVLMTVENTCAKCYWLTNFMETLLVQVWYPSTVATISREMKKVIYAALKKSGDVGLIDFKLHDFGCRGVSSMESALIGGMAHLINFKGTDTVPGLVGARRYYDEECAGFSIPAAEHSTITSWGRTGEYEAFSNMLAQYPTGLVAVVSDSFNIYDACSVLWGTRLKDSVMGRDGTLVVRPDSGTPHEVVPKILDILGSKFGYTVNSKFFKVLDPHIRVIQGDGIEPQNQTIERIYQAMFQHGWSADNIAFGSGGGLLQKMNRDTQKYAFKCSSIVRDGKEVDVYKQPVDAGWKASKMGRLMLYNGLEGYETTRFKEGLRDELQLVFENGTIMRNFKFKEIRDRVCV
jgi:nicotinamide phosphoribosyltransferase